MFFFPFISIFFLTFTEGKVLIFIVTSHPSGSVYSVSLSAQATETQTEIETERGERGNTNKCVLKRGKCTTVGTVWERRRGIIWRIKLKTPSSFLLPEF